MTYLTRAVITAVLITLLVWLGTGFVAGTLDMMSIHAGGRFAMLVFWMFLQGANCVAWGCAYADTQPSGKR